MSEQLLKTSIDNGIHAIALARPGKRNAVSDRLLDALEAALIATPEGKRVIILAGEGDHFLSAGGVCPAGARHRRQSHAQRRNHPPRRDDPACAGLNREPAPLLPAARTCPINRAPALPVQDVDAATAAYRYHSSLSSPEDDHENR